MKDKYDHLWMRNELGKIVDSSVSIPVPLALANCLTSYQLSFELWPLVVTAEPSVRGKALERIWDKIGLSVQWFSQSASPRSVITPRGRYSLIRAWWGRAASQGMFFGIFVLNRVSNLSFFVLLRVSIYQFLSQTGCLFLDDKQQILQALVN